MSRPVSSFVVAGALAAITLTGHPGSAQTPDLLADPAVRVLVEEVLIADLMLGSCDALVASEEGRAEVKAVADELARRAGYTPEEAAARLGSPTVRPEVEAGARRRLATLGATPEDPSAVCAAALRVVGREGVLGRLLLAAPEETQ